MSDVQSAFHEALEALDFFVIIKYNSKMLYRICWNKRELNCTVRTFPPQVIFIAKTPEKQAL